ncbi:MAG: efflux RND transporter periplasmic adaptor subunit [Flavobacteriaceae bacterium]|nr:efflux RND transporter periplasmic adaptor subunit [Flavobacteriaceae bacterium]
MKRMQLLILMMATLVISCKKEEAKKAMPPQEVAVVEILPKNISLYEDFVGQVYGQTDIPIRARIEGYLEGIHFEEGRRVKKGDLLYVIDSSPFQESVIAEQSKVAQAKTYLVQAESDLARIQPLAELNAVSKRDLDDAKANRDAAKSGLRAAKANLKNAQINLGYANVYAPTDGVIGKTLARVGEFVGREPNPVILNTVSDIDSVHVEFFLSEIEYLKLAKNYSDKNLKRKSSKKDAVEVSLILADGTDYEYQGHINFIDRSVNSSTGAILVQSTFQNPKNLIRPGQFARVKIRGAQLENAILVPQKCVTELQGAYSVFTVDKDNKVVQKQIELGQKSGRFYVVVSGLALNDLVVLEGLQKVRSGLVIKPKIVEFEGSKE